MNAPTIIASVLLAGFALSLGAAIGVDPLDLNHEPENAAHCAVNLYSPSCTGDDPNPTSDIADPCDHWLERHCDPNTENGEAVPDADDANYCWREDGRCEDAGTEIGDTVPTPEDVAPAPADPYDVNPYGDAPLPTAAQEQAEIECWDSGRTDCVP